MTYTNPRNWTIRQCSTWLEDNGYTGDAPDFNPFGMDRESLLVVLGEEDAPADKWMGILDDYILELVLQGMDKGEIPGLDDWRKLVESMMEVTPKHKDKPQ